MSFIEEKRIQKGGEERKEEQGRVGEGKEGKKERRGGRGTAEGRRGHQPGQCVRQHSLLASQVMNMGAHQDSYSKL